MAGTIVLLTGLGTRVFGQSSTEDPTVWFTSLGAFTVAAAIGWAWLRDVSKQRDRLLQAVEQQGPILTEMRDVMRTNSETLRAAAEAMGDMAEALKRLPTEAEITRLRDALAAAEARLRTRGTGR